LGQLRADPVPDFLSRRGERLDRADRDLDRGPSLGSAIARSESETQYNRAIAAAWNGSTMNDDSDKGERRAGGPAKKDPRRDRLKQALRENLKRRKSQARERNDIRSAPSHGETVAPHDGSGEKPGE
jgi:hypothetical protein